MNNHQGIRKRPSFLKVVFVAFLSVFSGSFAAPLIRLALNDGISAVWVAGLRMAAMLVVIWLAVFINRKLREEITRIPFIEFKWILLSGFMLAGHFFTLALSLSYASIFGTTTIFSTQYLFTVIIAAVFLKEKPGKGVVIGILISLTGIAVISWSDFNLKGDITGNLFSLISALFFAAYFVAGRHVRKSVTLWPYTVWVNTVCACLLLVLASIVNQPFKPLNMMDIGVFFGLAVFGSLGGHIGINWALKYVKSDVTSMLYLSQPVIAAILGWVCFKEQITWDAALGALLILGGVAFYILKHNKIGAAAKINQNT